MARADPIWLVLAASAAAAFSSVDARAVGPNGIGIHCPRTPYSLSPPWGTAINGVPVIVLGYPPYYGPPIRARESSWYWYGRPAAYWPSSYNGMPLNEVSRRLDPSVAMPPSGSAAPAAPPPRQAPEVIDLGVEALRLRDYPRAAVVYERRMQERAELESTVEPADRRADRTAQRLLGIALLGSDRLVEAQASIVGAYAEDAELAARGFDAKAVLGSASELRRLVNKAVSHAHRDESAEAWTMVAHLMSMEGRDAIAKKMLERAAAAKAEPRKGPGDPSHGPASFAMPKPEQSGTR
jgi:hypothetical protein